MNDRVKYIVDKVGLCGKISLERLTGGANNRSFKLTCGTRSYLLKEYFSHGSDDRDRLSHEFSFLTYSKHLGITVTPEPVFCDSKERIGLYEFVCGRPMSSNDVNATAVEQAGQFFMMLNPAVPCGFGQELHSAAESCFSIKEHLSCVERRISKLLSITPEDDIDYLAVSFIKKRIAPTWNHLLQNVLRKTADWDWCTEYVLKKNEQCISPSDFGFHNAILKDNGNITFIDFEYAGWDDPAKMVCDFFCQPRVSVKLSFFKNFARKAFKKKEQRDSVIQRSILLLPVYRMKWICIILNEFIPADASRRRFAGTTSDRSRRDQLLKAEKYLDTVRPDFEI